MYRIFNWIVIEHNLARISILFDMLESTMAFILMYPVWSCFRDGPLEKWFGGKWKKKQKNHAREGNFFVWLWSPDKEKESE